MLHQHLFVTAAQKVLTFLAKFSGSEFYERQIARKLGISYGSANRALNSLFATGAINRRREGRMYFYSVASSGGVLTELKKIFNLMLIEPLAERLKPLSSRIVLYGSCSQGADTAKSDLDLFIVTSSREAVTQIVSEPALPSGFEGIRLQPVIKTPVELLQAGESEGAFLSEVDRGIVLWEKADDKSGV